MFSTPNAGGANGSHIDFNALDSTRVQTVGSSAEMPRRGMMLDAVMKSGGNQFHGEAVVYGSSGAGEHEPVARARDGRGHRNSGAARALGRERRRWEAESSRTSSGFSLPFAAPVSIARSSTRSTPTARRCRTSAGCRTGPAKLSYQVTQSQKFAGFYHDAKELEHRGGSRFVPAESREVYEGPLATWGGTWQAVHGNSLVALDAERRLLPEGVVFRRALVRQHPGRQRRHRAVHKIPTLDTFTQLTDRRCDERRPVAASLSLSHEGDRQLLQAGLPRRQPSVQGRVRLHQFRIPPAPARQAAWELRAPVQQRRRDPDHHLQLSRTAAELRQLPGHVCPGFLDGRPPADAQSGRPLVHRGRVRAAAVHRRDGVRRRRVLRPDLTGEVDHGDAAPACRVRPLRRRQDRDQGRVRALRKSARPVAGADARREEQFADDHLDVARPATTIADYDAAKSTSIRTTGGTSSRSRA